MIPLIIFHSEIITGQGIEAFLTSNSNNQIYTVSSYSKCLDSVNFLQNLRNPFVLIIEGKLLDAAKCEQLKSYDQMRLILCDRPADRDSLLLALNYNSSYISLEDTDPQNLLLATQCAFAGAVYICPQARKQLDQCVFKAKREERAAITSLAPIDRDILCLTAQGYTQSAIGVMFNYTALNIGYRLRETVSKLGLQNKQQAISLAIDMGLQLCTEEAIAAVA